MSRTELVRLSGVSKQQLSRLENGQIRLRLDHLKPFASHLGYTPEQILLWGRYPGTGSDQVAASAAAQEEGPHQKSPTTIRGQVLEIDSRVGSDNEPTSRKRRKEGRHVDTVKSEGWVFPSSFVRDDLHTTVERLLVVGVDGDAMAPTVKSGERVIVDTGHKTPSPDGLYAIRDAFERIIVRRLQLLRSARPTRVKLISDNSNHASEEVVLSELEIVGKVVCCLKFF